ncbi:unnamed protein product [Phytomonas sp. EM1]|nr:unnamed protein product [Phytomonas sp. EM1]|eukprot:CCW62074.1 unnamed protein product [Phytomonas sp. isolate EM1]
MFPHPPLPRPKEGEAKRSTTGSFPLPGTSRSVYRVLLTGIPREVDLEEFYAHLRVHLPPRALPSLVNALLLRVPAAGDGDDHPRLPASSSASRKRGRAVGSRRSTGAAFVDFSSKAAAEGALSGGVFIAGAALRWRPLGTVVEGCEGGRGAFVAAEEAGRRAYVALAGGKIRGNESETENFRQGGHVMETRGVAAEEVEVELRLVADRPLARFYPLNGDGGGRLFHDLERALRQVAMGALCSLRRISDTEVHITVDRETAHYFIEKEATKSRSAKLCSVVTTSAVNSSKNDADREDHRPGDDSTTSEGSEPHASHAKNEEAVVWWELRRARPSLDLGSVLSNGNLSLASKSEVLASMARLMERTSGKFGAIRDAYGNLLFPN